MHGIDSCEKRTGTRTDLDTLPFLDPVLAQRLFFIVHHDDGLTERFCRIHILVEDQPLILVRDPGDLFELVLFVSEKKSRMGWC
jgi:hypothetical protein